MPQTLWTLLAAKGTTIIQHLLVAPPRSPAAWPKAWRQRRPGTRSNAMLLEAGSGQVTGWIWKGSCYAQISESRLNETANRRSSASPATNKGLAAFG
jgi:hypothetical protein